ncbi:MAG TPA: hypothetical protein VNQ79_12710 [Blastocatellia bacterium]|nr:hypothetical protein [Blastocatellia bacterium]
MKFPERVTDPEEQQRGRNWRWLTVLLALAVSVTIAFSQRPPVRIRFARGADSVMLEGSVMRGERDRYLVKARARQVMTVSLTSAEDNAVFQIYRPGGRKTLAGAGEGEDARTWSGKLPMSGDYLIVVGGTRGNASYKLEVKIR